jgi:hypothetical protein
MKNQFVIISMFIITIFVFFACSSQHSEIQQKKNDAIEKISSIAETAQFHQDALEKIKRVVKRSDYNIDLIVQIAEYIVVVPYETATLTRIAEIASKAEKECPQLFKVVELPIILAGGSDEIIKLAQSCTHIKTDSDIAKFERTIQKLKSQAKYKSIDEALAANNASTKSSI